MTTVDHPNPVLYKKKGYKTTLTTYDNIQSSPGLLKYSFSMGKRLVDMKNQSPCQIVGYTLPSTKTDRCAGFGIGDRFNHNQDTSARDKSPDPTAYNLPTQFRKISQLQLHKKVKSYCFGTGRESFKKNVLTKLNLPPDECSPGPAQYKPLKPIGEDKLKFKLKGKLSYGSPEHRARKNNVPGPGHYNDYTCLNKEGIYNFNSQWNNSKAAKWGPQYDRFRSTSQSLLTRNLGPGSHEQHGECGHIGHNGTYGKQINSLYHSIKTPGFGIGDRQATAPRFITPAPGSYRLPSDFGYVDTVPNPRTVMRQARNFSNRSAFEKNQDSLMSGTVDIPRVELNSDVNNTSRGRNDVVKTRITETAKMTVELYKTNQSKTGQNFYNNRRSSHNPYLSSKDGQRIKTTKSVLHSSQSGRNTQQNTNPLSLKMMKSQLAYTNISSQSRQNDFSKKTVSVNVSNDKKLTPNSQMSYMDKKTADHTKSAYQSNMEDTQDQNPSTSHQDSDGAGEDVLTFNIIR